MLIEHPLRYGLNPHQDKSAFSAPPDSIDILNGSPSYINILDILTGWQLTRDLSSVTNNVAAVSMKHCTPVGLAIPGNIDKFSKALLGVEDVTAATSAYIRARSSDWSAAYGDMVVITGNVNEELALILARLVSNGIAAFSYSKEALKILKNKKHGQYLIVKINESYEPPLLESREIFGIKLVQNRNNALPFCDDFKVIVGSENDVNNLYLDLKLAVIAMKYTVSNNMVITAGGRTLSISAGQQSRILSTQLACTKYSNFLRLQTSEIVDFVQSLSGKITDKFAKANRKALDLPDIKEYLIEPIVLGSDGFIPFKDNIVEAHRYGINVILEPEGAMRCGEIESAINAFGMTLIRTKNRYFYH